MGLKITTDGKPVMVFRDDKGKYPRYCIGVSSKDKDGNWINGYINCSFLKGVELEDKTKIYINDSFITLNKGKDDRVYKELKIMDFDEDLGKPEVTDIPDGIPEELPFK